MTLDVSQIKMEQILCDSISVLRTYMNQVIRNNKGNFLRIDGDVKLELEYDAKFGRYPVAARNITAGEVLFCETPLVCAPQGGGDPTCLKCLRGLGQSVSDSCPECGGPICPSCESSDIECLRNFHTSHECETLKKLNSKSWDLKLIRLVNAILTPLRTWLAIKEEPKLLPIVIAMQSNAKARKESAIGGFIDAVILPLLNDRLELDIPEEFVHHVCGIFDTNAYKIVSMDCMEGRALLPLTGVMAHDCCPNTDHWFSDDNNCVVRATRDIQQGEKVTSSYVSSFLPTPIRKKHLLLTKLFACRCDRCADSTEFDTFLSFIKCRACKSGLVAPPTTSGGEWRCVNCEGSLSAEMAMTLNKAVMGMVGNNGRGLENLPQLVHLVGLQHHSVLNLLISEVRGKSTTDLGSKLQFLYSFI